MTIPDDPELGYRYLVEEAREAAKPMAERTSWRICASNQRWSVFGKQRGKNGKGGPPVYDDLVKQNFTTAQAGARRVIIDAVDPALLHGCEPGVYRWRLDPATSAAA